MNKSVFTRFALLFLIVCVAFLSCADDGKYSSDPSHRLSFSRDTIQFDTVFTTIGTSTGILKVYNRNKEHLSINSVYLADAGKSGFKVNVDGASGTGFADLEVRRKDSMFVFVEVNVDPTNEASPVLIKDSLVFLLSNGVRQDVKLLAYGQDILILRGKTIEQDTVLTAQRPILVYDSLRVNEGATLTLEKGTKLYFHDKISCYIHGTLKAEGTLHEPVVFRGDRLDWLFSYLPYDRVPGQWGGIHFYETSYDNHLDFVDIHSADYGIRCDSSDVERIKLTLKNSLLHNMKADCLSATACKIRVGNSQITNAGNNCVALTGGDAEFVHCTIAGFYRWDMRKGKAVSIYNTDYIPLLKADFKNCLISGSSADELIGGRVEDESIAFEYSFVNSLVRTKLNEKADDYEEQLSHYINCLWDDKKDEKKRSQNGDKNFRLIKGETYEYDFRLDSISAAINLGLQEYALEYPFDLQGRSRLGDNGADAGCFEWMEGDGEGEE